MSTFVNVDETTKIITGPATSAETEEIEIPAMKEVLEYRTKKFNEEQQTILIKPLMRNILKRILEAKEQASISLIWIEMQFPDKLHKKGQDQILQALSEKGWQVKLSGKTLGISSSTII